jgi:hypothetical protein
MRRSMKLAKDIEVGDEFAGYGLAGALERRRVARVQRLPGGNMLVTWYLGGGVPGTGIFRPEQLVTEFADEIDEARGH